MKFAKPIRMSCLKNFKDCRGFILIDALIGLVILTVALLAATKTYEMATKQVTLTNDDAYAYYLAKQAVEKLKKVDRIPPLPIEQEIAPRYGYDGTNFDSYLPATSTDSQTGVTYTTTFARATGSGLSTNVQPVNVTVSWISAVGQQAKSIVLTTYCYNQPGYTAAAFKNFGNHNPPSPTPAFKTNQNAYSYFYTDKSKSYQLWSKYFNSEYSTKDLNYDNKTYNNKAGTASNTPNSNQPMTFAIPSTDGNLAATDKYLMLDFEAINVADVGTGNFSQYACWADYVGFYFTIKIDGQTVATNILIKASDSALNSITSNSTTKLVSGVSVTENDGLQIDIASLPTAIQNTITSNADHTLTISWTNDKGISPGKGVQGYDANVCVANISLTQTLKLK